MKTTDLIGPALDWAVAKCEDVTEEDIADYLHYDCARYSPSTNWEQGGPIIELKRINVFVPEINDYEKQTVTRAKTWVATIPDMSLDYIQKEGPTLLIAAMRCYVASKLGDEVKIPEELL